MENFPWTRLPKIETPRERKPISDLEKLRRLDPKSLREYLKDGNYGGLYQRGAPAMVKIWRPGGGERPGVLPAAWGWNQTRELSAHVQTTRAEPRILILRPRPRAVGP